MQFEQMHELKETGFKATFFRGGVEVGTILCAESMDAMRSVKDLDVIYIDPPFFTNRHLSVNGMSYPDLWESIDDYISWLMPRLELSRSILKDTGLLFVHLDWHAVHYVKVALDSIFGYSNFINEIIWHYRTGGTSSRHFSRKHDNILLYSKTSNYRFFEIYEKSYIKYRYGFSNTRIFRDEKGFYTCVKCRDVWDIPALRGNHPESLGFPTQKPVGLAERIISSSTIPGDIVGDFFCGSGTIAYAAAKSGRRWFAFDISPVACRLAIERIAPLCDSYTIESIDGRVLQSKYQCSNRARNGAHYDEGKKG